MIIFNIKSSIFQNKNIYNYICILQNIILFMSPYNDIYIEFRKCFIYFVLS